MQTPHTRIFLDGGDPAETTAALAALGFLDGQTTNPTLIAKNPEAQARLAAGKKFGKDEVYAFYKTIVQKVSKLIPHGSISIEVYADHTTTADTMVAQAVEMYTWIPNAHIKLPITTAGLAAAEELVRRKMRVNMTLCFSLEQAAAVYTATRGAERGQVFLSPFVGRLDDVGTDGISLIQNCLALFKDSDHHVEVLAASIRTNEHLARVLQLGCDIVTAPLGILNEWARTGKTIPTTEPTPAKPLTPLPFQSFDLTQPWQSFTIDHPLTEKGIDRFTADWNALIA